jgi:hypothetical protein
MTSHFAKRTARKVGLGATVALISLGLGAVGATPALAVGTVTATLPGSIERDSASLFCLDPTSVTYRWQSEGSALADAQGVFRFTRAPENATCTIHFNARSATSTAVEIPDQTIGGYLGWPDGFSGFEVFTTDPQGNAAPPAYGLVQAASVTGSIVGAFDLSQTSIELGMVRVNLLTGENVFDRVGDVVRPDVRSGVFTINNVSPSREYALVVSSPGYVVTWWGGSNALSPDPYDPTIARFVSAASGGQTPVGPIVLTAPGASVQGQALGFGSNATVTATNLLTGISQTAETTTSSYSVNGLTEGVYWVRAWGDGSTTAHGIVAVPASGATLLNLTAARVHNRSAGVTYTAIKGAPEVGGTMTAEASTLGQSYGLPVGYEYTWITANAILGSGPKLVVPNLAGQDLYLVTTVLPAGGAAEFTVSSANGKILMRTGPKFTVKVTGTTQVGKKLKATPSKAVKAKAWAKSYQWLRNGKPIAGKAAKKATYKLTAKDKGKKISVQVTVKRQGYTDSAATSKKTAKIKKK